MKSSVQQNNVQTNLSNIKKVIARKYIMTQLKFHQLNLVPQLNPDHKHIATNVKLTFSRSTFETV